MIAPLAASRHRITAMSDAADPTERGGRSPS